VDLIFLQDVEMKKKDVNDSARIEPGPASANEQANYL
jgi:hypothetical protein